MKITYEAEAEAGEKTSETVIQKIFASCPCREAKAELWIIYGERRR